MEIIQKRYLFGEDFTLSELFIKDIECYQCYILEDTVREVIGEPVEKWKIPKVTAIPVGRYKVVIDMSQRFSKLMLHLLDVQGFVGIRVHSGNTAQDTEGCLLAAMECNEDNGKVFHSRNALNNIFTIINDTLQRGEQVFWTVEGLPDEHPVSL